MNNGTLSYMLEPLGELLFQKDIMLRGYKEREGALIAGITCDSVPVEILASFNILPVRLPLSAGEGCMPLADMEEDGFLNSFDVIIMPDKCGTCGSLSLNIPVHTFSNPAGFGNDHSEALHGATADILKRIKGRSLKEIDISVLKEKAGQYNDLRRLVRAIAAQRRLKPGLVTNSDLYLIFNAASMLPPEKVPDYLIPLLGKMNEADTASTGREINALLYASVVKDPSLLDSIEETGCIIAEDDTCNGRRQFDLSFNVESDYIYYEILDAYSYKPLCPSVRPAEERYELFYKLLRNHGIDFVVLLDDGHCPARSGDIDFLRKKLMRMGIDPVTGTGSDIVARVKEYINRV